MTGLFREAASGDWQVVQIIGHMSDGGYICREIGRELPGVFIAQPYQMATEWRAA